MLSDELLSALCQYFNYPAFRPGQEQAINFALSGQNAMIVMPTGSGKSLIYQLAAMKMPGITLVISPLVALMKDQVDGMERRGLPATFINSTLDMGEQGRRWYGVENGQYKLVLVAPERFRSGAFRNIMSRVPLSMLAVDEAHCVSQWGHDFRPDYLRLADIREQFKPSVTLALTATATVQVQNDIVEKLGMRDAKRLVTGFNRPNLSYEVFDTPGPSAKLEFLRDFLRQAKTENRHGIIYTSTRKDAEQISAFANEACKLSAQFYHGALDGVTRARTQDAFLAGDVPLIVATNAFGMGIDRPDVRFVLHYALPASIEAYYQEAGRAGRDGLPGRAILLYSAHDVRTQEFLIENDMPTEQELRKVWDFVRRAGADQPISREDIERTIGISNSKSRLALDQLEQLGALEIVGGGAGSVMMQTARLEHEAVRKLMGVIEQRRRQKHNLLKAMLTYASADNCRRRLLLDYFGDHSPAVADGVCCDNCVEAVAAKPAQSVPFNNLTQSQRGALIVLDTIALLAQNRREVGKKKLGLILKGSQSEEVAVFAKNRNFGKFSSLKIDEIDALITQLMGGGYVKQSGSELPTLRLSSRGEVALQTKAAIDVKLRKVGEVEQKTHDAQTKLKRELGGTINVTGEMILKRGMKVEQVAVERGLTVSTIYSHCAELIASGTLSLDSVVPVAIQQQIRTAIVKVGDTRFLAPIKALLSESIEYGQIRCVVAGSGQK
jgi:ATP-dependent DNA helicase RecQ